MNFPEDLWYSEDHEWLRIEDEANGVASVGITDFAQSELGEIVYVEVETVGDTLNAGEEFGTVEAVKTTSDLFMPVDGEVLEVNENLDNDPESVNNSPYNEGWIIKIKISGNVAEALAQLMKASEYKTSINA